MIGMYQGRTWPVLLRTFFAQRYFWTKKLRIWYGASTSQVFCMQG